MFVVLLIYPLAADRAIRNHREVVRDALVNLLVAQRSSKTTTENHIVRLVFGKTTYDPVLNIEDASFAALVAAGPNSSRACVWETRPLYMDGYRTVAEGSAPELAESLVKFIGV